MKLFEEVARQEREYGVLAGPNGVPGELKPLVGPRAVAQVDEPSLLVADFLPLRRAEGFGVGAGAVPHGLDGSEIGETQLPAADGGTAASRVGRRGASLRRGGLEG